MKKITMYCIPNDSNNLIAEEMIKNIPDTQIKFIICPLFTKDLYRMPFISDEKGGRWFGITDIKEFIKREKKNA